MATFYVSPTGSDASSGTSPTLGETTGPFATLARAQQAMRASPGADTTYLLEGTHTLSGSLALTAADSGSSFMAMAGTTPVVTSGTKVGGWTVGADGIWRAQLATSSVTQLTVGGVAQTEARYPNFDPAQPATGGWLWAKPLPTGRDAALEMAYDKAAVPAGVLAPGAKVVVFTQLGYENDVLTVASVDSTAGVVRFAVPANDEIGPGSRFYVSGRAVHLDQPGEWWFDSASRTLSYRAPAGFTGADAVASGGNQGLITLNGATGVSIKGLTFADLSSTATQAEDVPAAITIANGSGNTVEGNRFTNVGKGVVLDDNAHHNTVAGNSFEHLLSNAIELTPTSHENQVTGNTISHTGTLYRAGGAIELSETWGNLIAGNRIEDVPRFGIAEFNYSPGVRSGGNTIEHNIILHSGQETNDAGAIYVFSAPDPGAAGDTIRYNRIVDTGGLGTDANGFNGRLSWGIYLDDEASNAEVYGNFVSGTSHGGVMLHGGVGNHVHNNVLLDNAVFGIELLELDHPMTGTSIHHNVVEIPDDTDSPIVSLDRGYVSPSAVHHNVYLSPGGAVPVVAGLSFAQWQAAGGDAGTVVTTDAGFVDPAGGNYTFRAGSVALTAGIDQLPWTSITGNASSNATISLAGAEVVAREGTGGTVPFAFTVTRAGSTATAHSVDFSVSGAAEGGRKAAGASDFGGGVLPSGTVTFAPGASTATITVNVASDAIGEADERFAVTLANPSSGASIGNATAYGIIQDDDAISSTPVTDILRGTAGADMFLLNGGGLDLVLPGAGTDLFVFGNVTADTPTTSSSMLFSFDPGAGERLDLSAIDAIAASLQDDAFTFVGTAAFSGSPGELRWEDRGSFKLIQGNVDTDSAAELTIFVKTGNPVEANWFIL
jgi:parallel beta-helix repeat protein